MGIVAGWVLSVALICLGGADLASAADEQVVFREAASGTKNTRPFTVQDGWELRWEVRGNTFAAFLHTADGQAIAELASVGKPGPGATFHPKGGTYFLEIIARGDWTVTVVQLP